MKFTRVFIAGVAVVAIAPVIPSSAAMRSAAEESFLTTVAQGQENVVMLGQLATRKASSRSVKQFAAKMIEDHQIAQREVRRLGLKEGIQLPVQVSEKQKRIHRELAMLRNQDFDREYMRHMLRDHAKEVTEFEQQARQLADTDIKRWASDALPVLKQHLQKALHITPAMIIEAAQPRFAEHSDSGPPASFAFVDPGDTATCVQIMEPIARVRGEREFGLR
ncbi:MAG: hypothetical protein A4E19_13700 [Nitrospira sp. SG-bin1]|nr:MAG: hypothetical protein A4E19_13700 [Nitrospira sp. SG-bin1]